MAGLEVWLKEQIEGGKAEPNFGLGQAITYRHHCRKHTFNRLLKRYPLPSPVAVHSRLRRTAKP